MSLLHVRDLGEGHIQVSWHRGNEIPRTYGPIPFADPLTPEDRRELRWYLEDYLGFPFGAEEYRAKRLEDKMAEWGECLFRQVFVQADAGPHPRLCYHEAVREGLERCELCITSEDPAFLNIPWELIRDPAAGRGYLAPSLGGLFRQHTGQRIQVPQEVDREGPFRILLVIARPFGDQDIPLGTVARPVLEALQPLRPGLELEVLRPPTFDALVSRLNARRGFYHLVHFDGHGSFAGPAGRGPFQFRRREGEGHLVFEREDGTPHVVSSEELGQALATCRVRLFVLNACQSAEEGEQDPFSSVASQLVAIGAEGVVAMSYSVYADAAALFMGRFYERLIEHASLAEAVAAARRRLYTTSGRGSVVGELELSDWMVPVLYQQEVRYVPIPEGTDLAAPEERIMEEVVLRQRVQDACPSGRFGFIGRDYDLLRIERALREDDHPWALLSGMGGIGKTELARGFARWYAETGGCPEGVFATSFKEKADFGQVMGSVFGFGTDFSRLAQEEQWRRLVGYLRENPCLLVWDNFETVAGYPEGAEPLATDEEQDRLSRFLRALRGGKSRVLITTRKRDEAWLGVAPELVELRGLSQRDAARLARAILRTVGRQPEDFRHDPDYAQLIRLLQGHPRSLEVVLPRLRDRSPREIIDALQHRVDRLGEAMEDASLSYAFSLLSDRTRRHLPFIGLFVSYVDADTLGLFVGAGDEQEPIYAEIVGKALDAQGWEAVLEEAGRNGLLRPLGQRVYALHPTLPPFLRKQLVTRVGQDGLAKLDAEFVRFYVAWAAHFFDDVRKGEPHAVTAVRVEEANLLRALRLAERGEGWAMAQAIVQTLGRFYEVQGREEEWRALRGGLLRRLGRGIAPDADRGRANLWMYLLGNEANDALERNELGAAEAAIRTILQYLLSLDDPAVEPKIAGGYHQLGIIAQERGELDQAEEWYGRALEITERLELQRDAASDYHQLGTIAEDRVEWDQAEGWYRKALEIFERLGLERDAASTYHQLGNTALRRGQLDQAEEWYGKALEIFERLGLKRDAADEYHQLGMIAHERGQLEVAEEWYRQALEIFERLGLKRDAADEYHQLGNTALLRGQLDLAEEWYRKALEMFERLGLERVAASTYHQLGIIAQERGQWDLAEERCGKALEIYERLGLERDAASTYHQLGMVAQERGQWDQAEEWYRKALEIRERLGHPPLMVQTLAQFGVLRRRQNRHREAVSWLGRAWAIAEEHDMRVGRQILVSLARLLREMGEEAFTAAWRQTLEGEPPLAAIRKMMEALDKGTA